MYYNIFDNKRYELLKTIVERISIKDYYMIGGTALSLQLGLRESLDFDFCVPHEFNNEMLIDELNTLGELEVIQNQKGTCDVILDGVQVSFFYYPNKIVDNLVHTNDITNLRLASILDIAIMKIVAIGGRGAKKDFFDLYNILKRCNYTVEQLAKGLRQKCGNNVNYMNLIMGLSYFEDAESEVLPKTFVEYDWDEIKNFFIKFQNEFQKALEH